MQRKQDTILNVKTQLEIAAELIRARQYDKARTVLNNVDHSKAKEWLRRLDEIAQQMAQETVPEITSMPIAAPTLETVSGSAKQEKPSNSVTKGGCLFFLLIVALCSGLPQLFPGNSPSNSQTGSRGSQSSYIDIVDPRDTGIPEEFFDTLKRTVSAFGSVDYYEGQMTNEGRLLLDIEVALTSQSSDRIAANLAMERILRAYVKELPSNKAGRISVRIFWERDGLTCSTGVGMGYRVQEQINWRDSWPKIVLGLDKNNYSDNTSSYADVAWRPSISGGSQCRE